MRDSWVPSRQASLSNVIKGEGHMPMQIWKMSIESNDVCYSMGIMELW